MDRKLKFLKKSSPDNLDKWNERQVSKGLKNNNEQNTNREIIIVTYMFVGLFFLLIGNFTYFMIADSQEIINNPYNKRQDLLAKRVIRGEIQANGNEVLAKTLEQDGKDKRVYPYGNMFAHIVGHSEKGKTGIESSQNFKLLTSHDNPFRKVVTELAGDKNPGDNVVTTLDVGLQKTAYNALGSQKGAVVVLEPSTGKILAMVSKPDYDPNHIAEDWGKLTNDDDNSALLNRAAQGLYPPGSTFKILTALEYIMEQNGKYENYTYTCEGTDIINNVEINCYNKKHHKKVDLAASFAKSCNTSFANLGKNLNIDSFRNLCETFLFNKPLPTDIPYRKSSFVLDKKSAKGEIPQTVIGQGKTEISPLHNALITAAIANGGVLMKPYVVDHLESVNGTMVKKYVPSVYDTLISTKEAEVMTELMEETVKSGTAASLSGLKIKSAGKTGSAEYDSSKASHAWYVGFAPVKNPELVVSIIVEGAGTGSDYAVPIAKQIYKEYFNRKQ